MTLEVNIVASVHTRTKNLPVNKHDHLQPIKTVCFHRKSEQLQLCSSHQNNYLSQKLQLFVATRTGYFSTGSWTKTRIKHVKTCNTTKTAIMSYFLVKQFDVWRKKTPAENLHQQKSWYFKFGRVVDVRNQFRKVWNHQMFLPRFSWMLSANFHPAEWKTSSWWGWDDSYDHWHQDTRSQIQSTEAETLNIIK